MGGIPPTYGTDSSCLVPTAEPSQTFQIQMTGDEIRSDHPKKRASSMLPLIARAGSSRLAALASLSAARSAALRLPPRARACSPTLAQARRFGTSSDRYRPLPTLPARRSVQPPLKAAPAPSGISDTPGLGHELVHPQAPPEVAPVPGTILDKFLPKWAEGAKPYLLLTRFDKPIGSALLFWPCSKYPLGRHLPIQS